MNIPVDPVKEPTLIPVTFNDVNDPVPPVIPLTDKVLLMDSFTTVR